MKTPLSFPSRAMVTWLCCLAAVGAGTAFSQEWTRFRGPNGHGIGDAKGMPAEFGTQDYEWIVELPGTGHSSPVLWGEKLFLTVNAKEGAERKVMCLDSTNGSTLWEWSQPFTEHAKNKLNDFASSTPVVDEKAIYLTWTSGEETQALALDHSGKELWRTSWKGFTSDHGSAASPILSEGVLIIHTDAKDERHSFIYGLNPADGSEVWSRERITPPGNDKHLTAYSTPVEVKSGDRNTVALLSTNHGWLGLDPKNGEIAWSYPEVYGFRSVGSILEFDGNLFATLGSGGGGKQSAALHPNGTDKPDLLYSLGKTDLLSYVPTPLFHDGLLFLCGDGGVIACRDAKTGEKFYEERAAKGQFFSSPVLVDGKIYFGSRDGLMLVIAATREFKVLAENRLGSGLNATPAIANGRMFIRTDTHLMSLKGK